MLKTNENYNKFDEELGESENSSNNERITIEEPASFIQMAYEKLLIIISLCSICLVIFAKMFAVVSVPVCFKIFYWMGAIALLFNIVIYIMHAVKTQKVKFDIQLGSLVVAVIAAVFIG